MAMCKAGVSQLKMDADRKTPVGDVEAGDVEKNNIIYEEIFVYMIIFIYNLWRNIYNHVSFWFMVWAFWKHGSFQTQTKSWMYCWSSFE